MPSNHFIKTCISFTVAGIMLLSVNSVGAKSTVGSRTGRIMSNNSQQWNCLSEEGGWDGALKNAQQIDAIGGTFSRLRVKLNAVPNSSYTFTVQNNGTNQTPTCTISGSSSTSCTDLTDTFTTVAGDLVNITKTASGTPTARNGYYSIVWSNAAVQDPLLGGYINNALSTSGTDYLAIEGCNSNITSTEINASQLVATGGTLGKFYVDLDTAPGAGTTRVFTLVQNEVASGVTCTVSGTATTCNDTSDTVTLSAGDRLSIKSTVTGTPAASFAHYGLNFKPTIEGESLYMKGAGGNPLQPSTTATNYSAITDDTNWNATETNVQTIVQSQTIKGLYINLSVAPNNGAGVQSYAFTVEKNGAATNITCTVSEAATTCSDTTDTSTVVDDDLLGIKCVPSGTPAATNARIGTVSLIKRRYYTN